MRSTPFRGSLRIAAPSACSLALVLALAGSAAAVEIDAAGLFAALDANADGRVTQAEAGKEHGRLFDRLLRTGDDGDGQLSADEFAAGLTPVRAEKELVVKQGSRLPGSDALVVLLAQMDANADQRLVAGEIPARFRGAFEAMIARGDDDKNGRLDQREIARGGPVLTAIAVATAARLRIDVPSELAKLPQARRQALEGMNAYPNPGEMMSDPEQAAALFARLDADGDQLLSVEEAPEGMANLVRRGDRDGDGKLSVAEFQGIARRRGGAAPMQPDGGGLPADATPQQKARKLFQRLDANRDGGLTRDELTPRMAESFDELDRDGNGSLDTQEFRPLLAVRRRPQSPAGPEMQPQMDEEMQ